MSNIRLFNYRDTNDPKRVEEITTEIRHKMRIVSESMLGIGQALIEVKSLMDFGTWQEWCIQELDFSLRTAERLIAVAKKFPELDEATASNIQISALYDMTSAKTPDAIVDLAFRKARDGYEVKRIDLAEWQKNIKPVKVENEEQENQRKIIAYVKNLEKRICEAGHWGEENYEKLMGGVSRIMQVVEAI